jgi:hypothetical protein
MSVLRLRVSLAGLRRCRDYERGDSVRVSENGARDFVVRAVKDLDQGGDGLEESTHHDASEPKIRAQTTYQQRDEDAE